MVSSVSGSPLLPLSVTISVPTNFISEIGAVDFKINLLWQKFSPLAFGIITVCPHLHCGLHCYPFLLLWIVCFLFPSCPPLLISHNILLPGAEKLLFMKVPFLKSLKPCKKLIPNFVIIMMLLITKWLVTLFNLQSYFSWLTHSKCPFKC